MSRPFALLVALIIASVVPASADPMADIVGRWRESDGDFEVAISRCGNALCGVIVALREPRTDTNNPDPALRGRSLLGVRVLSGFRPTGDASTLNGDGYNPDNGKTYRTQLSLRSKDALMVRGCVLGGMVCDDDVWTRRH